MIFQYVISVGDVAISSVILFITFSLWVGVIGHLIRGDRW